MTNYPQYPQYQPVRPNSTLAIISIISAILGLTVLFGVGSVIAVVTGHMAKGEIARSGGTLGGEGAATWGLVLGYIGLALSVVGFCLIAVLALAPILFALFAISSNPNSLLPLVRGLI
jgi:hypothetical protein